MRFLVNGHNGAISFGEIFLNEDKLFNKHFNAIEVARLPQAFLNNLGELSSSDVAFIIFNQFFGKVVDSDVIKALTSRCIESIAASKSEDNPKRQELIDELTAAIINSLLHYYISVGRVSEDVNIVCYGDIEFLRAANSRLGHDILAFTNKADIVGQRPNFPVFVIKGDNAIIDGQLVATAACYVNSSGRRVLFFSQNNIATLLAYIYAIVDKIRESLSRNCRCGHYCVVESNPNQTLSQAIKLVNTLGLDVALSSSPDEDDRNVLSITLHRKMNIPNPLPQQYSEHITKIAPSVQIIKQLII